MSRRLLCAAPLWLAAAGMAQDTVDSIKKGTLDLSVPESPAFTVLGLTPQTVIRPTSPRAFATDLLNGVDPNGNFQTGIAIDTAPYFLAYGDRITLEQYRKNPTVRFLSRTQLSVATAKGASENDKAARLSAGLHFVIFDLGDARGNLQFQQDLSGVVKQAKAKLAALGVKEPETVDQAQQEAYDQRLKEMVETLAKVVRESYRKSTWNRSSFVIGAAPTWISASGTNRTIQWNGGAVWGSMAYGFDNVPGLKDNAQIIVHARYRNKDRIPKPGETNQYYIQNSAVVGARARVGTPDTIASFELAYLHTDPRGLRSDDYLRITLGAEKRLTENIWLQFGAGGESGKRNNTEHLFLLTTLKWGFAQK